MVLLQKDIFKKQIDRPIDGVIKADDMASLRVELDEYVITGEIGRCLERFFDVYNNYHTSNGVWISGFFGSGKSHLLKMLAVLLENHSIDDGLPHDIFNKKLENQPMLFGAVEKAVSIPSKSILFNIDQKADIISKKDTAALLSVFQRVFDDACGFFGKQAYIAQFERDLHKQAQFENFKIAYENVSGKKWERGREEVLFEKANIATAFANVTGDSMNYEKDILGQYRKDTSISIEDFASSVKAWIDTKPKGFRLNFFVDEVGQYIADNVKLMTNLQTIAESLNTKCRGQSWIVVTAQEELESVIGDMSSKQAHDFSKIQARFDTKMHLNSTDVAEVIQRRLLEKTPEGEIKLRHLHDQWENDFRTIFDFVDESINLKNYQDCNHFIKSHPFPPYQYDLFRMAITGLSSHNAFEGRHSSVGERSMLGVFQSVAKKLMNNEIDELASFDLMFEGVRTALKSSVQQRIQIAENNLEDEFAIRVLKVLFLVKYVEGFKSSVRNIGILLFSKFGLDFKEQNKRIDEALNVLERNTYIRRNGENYEFLTNEEKDVEDDIREIEIDSSELLKEIEELAYSEILRHKKIRHVTTGIDYQFSRKLDDLNIGREYEVAINLLSPLFGDNKDSKVLCSKTMSSDELVISVPADQPFVEDLARFKKTQKFVRQFHHDSSRPERSRIISQKRDENGHQAKQLEMRLRTLISKADFFVRGEQLVISCTDPQERIKSAFQFLVDKVFSHLPMLQGVSYSEADIYNAVKPDSGLFRSSNSGIDEAQQEVLNYIERQLKTGIKVSVKGLGANYIKKPYGWPNTAVLCIVGGLVASGKIQARLDGDVKEGKELANLLVNNRNLPDILLTSQREFSVSEIAKAKEVYQELFSKPTSGSDARSLGNEWRDSIQCLTQEVDNLITMSSDYPFLVSLRPFYDLLNGMQGKHPNWFITEIVKLEDELLNQKEDTLDRIKFFMNGPQRGIYDDARGMLDSQASNIDYIDFPIKEELSRILNDKNCYKGNIIQSLKNRIYTLKEKIELRLLEERNLVISAVDEIADKIRNYERFNEIKSDKQTFIMEYIDNHKCNLENTFLIAVLCDKRNKVQTTLMGDVIEKIDQIIKSALSSDLDNKIPAKLSNPEQNLTSIHVSQLKIEATQLIALSDEKDVDLYLAELKKTILEEIFAGKKVIV